MGLEQRVEVLEKEIEVLKNQIQGILLDIKEQMLTNTYPTLRAEDVPASSAPTNPNLHQIALPEVPQQEMANDDSSYVPAVNKVRLNNVQASPAGHQNQQVSHRMLEIEEWLRAQIQKHGTDYARNLIQSHANNGMLSEQEYNALKNIIMLFEEQASSSAYAMPSNPVRMQGSDATIPMNPHARVKKTRKSVDNANKKPVSKQASTRPSTKTARTTANKLETTTHHKSGSRAIATPVSDEDDQDSNVVLRLIAGIQNAGAGITWKKRHG